MSKLPSNAVGKPLSGSIFFYLAGLATPLVLAATGVGRAAIEPVEPVGATTLGEVGRHRLLPNSLVYKKGDEYFVLTYHAARKTGGDGLMFTITGSVESTPLRVVIDKLRHPADANRAGSPSL